MEKCEKNFNKPFLRKRISDCVDRLFSSVYIIFDLKLDRANF